MSEMRPITPPEPEPEIRHERCIICKTLYLDGVVCKIDTPEDWRWINCCEPKGCECGECEPSSNQIKNNNQ